MTDAARPSFPSFDEFFAETHNNAPYSWQRELAAQVLAEGWPSTVRVPTGLGKTASIAVAVYALAHELHHAPHPASPSRERPPRRMPQRIFHLVNRRVLVDDTHSYVHQLAEKINKASASSPLGPVRTALQTLLPQNGPGKSAIAVASLRGGLANDPAWLRATGCVIVSMTPHQFVSRLLMRGFGVSNSSRPIHAGLVGMDRLVLFDEPHLSTPAYAAIRDAERLQARAEEPLGIPLGATVALGATIPAAIREESDNDRSVEFDPADERIKPRFTARRTLSVRETRTASDGAFVDAMAKSALAAHESGASAIVVFANTVAVAQGVYSRLLAASDKGRDVPGTELITSRFRPIERMPLPDSPTGIVVTTQCLEVGVDVTFDAMITEAVPWGTLVQRLGRLNRDGSLDSAAATLVTAGTGAIRKGSAAVYGEQPIKATLDLLSGLPHSDDGGIDVSTAALQRIHDGFLSDHAAEELEGPAPRNGTLHSGLVPLMTQTRPSPIPDLPVEAFISGPDAPVNREVRVAWRDDPEAFATVPNAQLEDAECLTISERALRAFLRGVPGAGVPLADLDTTQIDAEPTAAAEPLWERYAVFAWDHAAEEWRRVRRRQDLDAGRLFLLDGEIGGYSPKLGWTGRGGEEAEPVRDVSLAAAIAAVRARSENPSSAPTGTSTWVVTPTTIRTAKDLIGDESLSTIADALEHTLAKRHEDSLPEDEALAAIQDAVLEKSEELISLVRKRTGFNAVAHVDQETADAGIVTLRWRAASPKSRGTALGRVTLDAHQEQVGTWAEQDAETAGLRQEVVSSLGFAGRWHDVGKLDPSFQRLLAEDPSAGITDAGIVSDSGTTPFLAKSSPSTRETKSSLKAARRLRLRCGIPEHWRHEWLSAAAMRLDREDPLAAHVVGAHHGYRVGPPPARPDQRDGFAHTPDFLTLNRRYGPWGLAYLESVLRLADWRASAHPDEAFALESGTAAAQARAVERAKSAASSNPAPGDEVVLSGLISHPTTGWYAAAGLLAAALELGDADASICWRPVVPGGDVAVPAIASEHTLERLVGHVCDAGRWERAQDFVLEHVGGKYGLWAKSQKLKPARALRELLLEADERGLRLVLGLVGDLGPQERQSQQVPLPLNALANNSNYPSVARDHVARGLEVAVPQTVSALLDVNAGYSAAQCDGGFDRHDANSYAITGVGSVDDTAGLRATRTALAPLAVYGMAALGHTGALGFGRARIGRTRALRLPLPQRPTSFDELRALLLSVWSADRWDWAAIDNDAVLEAEFVDRGDSDKSWRPSTKRR